MKARFTPLAQEEIRLAGLHYEIMSPQASESFFARVREAMERLRTGAGIFPLIQGLKGGREIRYLSLDRFPYSLNLRNPGRRGRHHLALASEESRRGLVETRDMMADRDS